MNDNLSSCSSARLAIDTIRTLAMDAVQAANSGHPGTPMALAPLAHTLWTRFLRYDPATPDWPNRDRFVLSCGHASMLLYALLHLADVVEIDADGKPTGKPAVGLDDIRHFRQLGSRTPGHPEYRMTTGVETTTGPLGQGCGNSVGMAIAARWLARTFNREGFTLFDNDVYVVCSDGDMMEGVASEAASMAGHLRLANLCWIYDSNHVTIEGDTDLAFDEDVALRFEAYGWKTITLADAEDTEGFAAAIGRFRETADRPTLIVVRSVIGFGFPTRAGTSKAHSDAPGVEEIRGAKRAYGWPEDATFLVPDEAKRQFSQAVSGRGRPLREAWQAVLQRYEQAHPDLARALQELRQGKLPGGWSDALPKFPPDAKGMASREASGKVLNAIAAHAPSLIGGAADLSPSTRTDIKDAASLEATTPGGRNLHFGVREHAMGAIANGMALTYLRPYTGTFLVFSDYMRPPIRLAAIMELPVVFVFTHDSIGVGEDGPTHQPIEHLAALRAIPGLDTIRPGDANETAVAWKVALRHTHEPTALILSRQPIATLDRGRYAAADGLERGGYVLADAQGGDPEIILIGTGSELPLAVAAHEKLASEGVRSRVVSLPSWYLFEKQDSDYRDSVLPPAVRARLAIEQGGSLGWDRYVGHDGATLTMSTFGASAPIAKLQQKFGFTLDNVCKLVRQVIERNGPSRLMRLGAAGQAVWLDFVERKFLARGGLRRLVEKDGVTGVTSNPSIFEKAMGQGDAYDEGFRDILGRSEAGVQDIYERQAIADIKAAAADLRPVYERLRGRDGYVSLEVSPHLANSTQESIEEGRRLWKLVAEPNLMVKVPATKSGVPTIRALIEDGININVTLLFSMESYQSVATAFMEGLEARVAKGRTIDRVASVASFFVSRIDSQIDRKIDERVRKGDPQSQALQALRGRVAIANAKLAYAWYLRMIASERWRTLAARGAMPQRLLWASTGTKDPAYPDTLYVDSLIGPDTVNTMPPKTMDAFRDHGTIATTLTADLAEARKVLSEADRLGLDLPGATQALVVDGVKQFSDAADALLAAVAAKRADFLASKEGSR